ncbi:hypothetical protein HOLleu_00020 [Holothuria leucospilota]|uniref:Uncharacterized protein n=1 Tax=Holothuria leucospilota TaxID=206669 RepID=A0A9Q1CMA6_HOLLE|nr:hypothetical protein HOLleu_00020 [Holothuria leucospilota]
MYQKNILSMLFAPDNIFKKMHTLQLFYWLAKCNRKIVIPECKCEQCIKRIFLVCCLLLTTYLERCTH